MKKLYNEDFKRAFINQYTNEKTKETTENVLANAALTEEVLGKDLYDFSLDEIGQVIRANNPMNEQSAYNIGRHIYRYILFAKSVRRSNLHPMDGLPTEWYGYWVDKKKYLFSFEEIKNIIGQLENEQDKALIALLFEGVQGYKNSELRNLERQDIDFEKGELRLRNDEDQTERKINVSQWCLDIVLKAIDSLHYKRLSRVQEELTVPVVDNDYVFRPIQTRRIDETARISYTMLYNRLRKIADKFHLPYFRAKNIQKSGMNYRAYQLYMERGKLGDQELKEISKQFNVGNYIHGSGNEEYLNVTLFRNHVNRDNILKMYGVDINKMDE